MEEDTNGSNRNSPTVPADPDMDENINGSNRNSPTVPVDPDVEEDTNGSNRNNPTVPVDPDVEEDTNGSNRNIPTNMAKLNSSVPADPNMADCNGSNYGSDSNGSSYSCSTSSERLSNERVVIPNFEYQSARGPSHRDGGPQRLYNERQLNGSAIPPSHRDGGAQKSFELLGNFFIIRPKTICHDESSEKIPEEEAICRFCYGTFKEENVLMLTCNCNKKTLAHEACSNQNNNNCEACEEELQKLLVTLHLEPNSSHLGKTGTKKGSCLPLFKKLRRS